jgi:nifR3 family TIM-barrel protein
MAGVTTSSFRKICLKHGAGIVYAEMISDKGLEYNNEKTLKMIEIDQDEHPIAMQVFGNSYETITPSVGKILERSNVDIIDVNMGCPVNKVVKGGSGSALLKTPEKIYDIVKSLKDNYNLPITIKIRAGWDASSINCDVVTKLATKAGVDAIAIHGRTRAQMYNGNANLEYIKMVKNATDKPVIGNGDIKDYTSAKKMLEETNVDALMIGRASLGNPWVFEEIEKGFNKELIVKPTKEIIIDTLLEHARVLMASKGEHIAMIEMRTHAGWYLKQIPGTKQYRPLIVSIKTMKELENICNDVLNNPYIN